jgi:hypothetical protein
MEKNAIAQQCFLVEPAKGTKGRESGGTSITPSARALAVWRPKRNREGKPWVADGDSNRGSKKKLDKKTSDIVRYISIYVQTA